MDAVLDVLRPGTAAVNVYDAGDRIFKEEGLEKPSDVRRSWRRPKRS